MTMFQFIAGIVVVCVVLFGGLHALLIDTPVTNPEPAYLPSPQPRSSGIVGWIILVVVLIIVVALAGPQVAHLV